MAAGLAALAGSYLREKGKNVATKGDIHEITKKVEEVKAEVGKNLWIHQERWKLKKDLYRQLDLDAGTLRLDPGTTKNDEGRVVYLTPELARLLSEQLERIRAVERKAGRIIPYLFPYLSGRHRAGSRRRDFRKTWASACEKSGCPGMLRHDFRRTAVRNLVNAGVPEKVAMTITGHRTRSVFDRYHIVSPADLRAATRRLVEADGHVSGHVRPAALDGDARKSAE